MLYIGCLLTVGIELAWFALAGYGRKRYFLLLCTAVNVATNLTLNLLLYAYRSTAVIFTLEALVVLTEYAVYAASEGRSKRLFLLTLGANAASFLTGVFLFGL